MRSRVSLLILLTSALSLNSCGGSGSNRTRVPNPPPPPPPAAMEEVSAIGVITALGSATVNGVVYNTDSTTVTRNGQAGTFTDLELGQIVSLDGMIEVSAPRGTADEINYEATVIGGVEGIEAGLRRLVVMGQSVRVDDDTVFDSSIDPISFAGLLAGDDVEISGFREAGGEVVATRVEPAATGVGPQTIGVVTGLDLANSLFSIGALTIDYSSASVIDLPAGMPTDGLFVLVRGPVVSGILVADSVEALFDASGGTPGERAQTQGVITRFASATDFDVNGFPITTDTSTAYSGGTVTDLQANVEITVDGEISSSGDSVLANRISYGEMVSPTTTLDFNLGNFDEISVRSVFKVTVSQDSDFLVQVTIDADDANRVDVTQTGNTLNIGLLPATGSDNIRTIEAVVTMPALAAITTQGVIDTTLNNFSQPQLQIDLGGVSRLYSDSISIVALTANVVGVSQLDLGDARPLGTANIDITGVSTATLNMNIGSTLSGIVTGVSSLNYYGTNVVQNLTIGTGASLNRLGETRP